jgi:hypothetical protein
VRILYYIILLLFDQSQLLLQVLTPIPTLSSLTAMKGWSEQLFGKLSKGKLYVLQIPVGSLVLDTAIRILCSNDTYNQY